MFIKRWASSNDERVPFSTCSNLTDLSIKYLFINGQADAVFMFVHFTLDKFDNRKNNTLSINTNSPSHRRLNPPSSYASSREGLSSVSDTNRHMFSEQFSSDISRFPSFNFNSIEGFFLSYQSSSQLPNRKIPVFSNQKLIGTFRLYWRENISQPSELLIASESGFRYRQARLQLAGFGLRSLVSETWYFP